MSRIGPPIAHTVLPRTMARQPHVPETPPCARGGIAHMSAGCRAQVGPSQDPGGTQVGPRDPGRPGRDLSAPPPPPPGWPYVTRQKIQARSHRAAETSAVRRDCISSVRASALSRFTMAARCGRRDVKRSREEREKREGEGRGGEEPLL